MSLDSVYTSATYNSYFATVDEATAEIRKLKGFIDVSSWEDSDSDITKENISLAATKDLNSFAFEGATNSSIVSPYNMTWPRSGTLYQNGVSILDDEIPIFVLEYLARRCIEILDFDQQKIFSTNLQSNIKKQKIGSLEKEFFSPKDMAGKEIDLNDFPSYDGLRPYIESSVSSNLTYLVRA